MRDDNGAGLRALFYGLCCFHGIAIWGPDHELRSSWSPAADFLLPVQHVFVIIVPKPVDRQVEIAAVLGHHDCLLILDRDDVAWLRSCSSDRQARQLIDDWCRSPGRTHAAHLRQMCGLTPVTGS